MNSIFNKTIGAALLLILAGVAGASEGDEHGHEENKVLIMDEIAEKSQIKTQTVSPGVINEQIKTYGKTVNDPTQVSHIRARFQGTIVSVNVRIGDEVAEGDVLAYIESNESLNQYPVKALMSGVIVARHANPGELAMSQVLFTVANFDKIWVELQVFPSQLPYIKAGQKVVISGLNMSTESEIQHIIPSLNEQPYSVARVLINNQSHEWVTGLLVSGQVMVNTIKAEWVVPAHAIQIINETPVVFVKEGQSYKVQPVKLGITDGKNTEVLSGLHLGDEYVSENSYLIKADIKKSGASHAH